MVQPVRRRLLQAGAALGASAVVAPAFLAYGRDDKPIRIGMIDPTTSTYAAEGGSEIEGARLALEEINRHKGILGRPVELIIEDSAANAGQASQKAFKLFRQDQVDMLMGAVSSAVALSISQVAHDHGKVCMITGGHTDPVTGDQCHWTTFRICTTTYMLADGLAKTLVEKYGKKWYFITPDYAYGHSIQANFEKILKPMGGTILGSSLSPLGTTDFSSYLIRAQAAHPEVLCLLVGGGDQLNCLKQAAQFGLPKKMAIGGGLTELEVLQALPAEARVGWWTLEWWWDQPKTAHVKEFVETYRRTYNNKTPSARSWFGYAGLHALALGAEKARSIEPAKLAHALEGLELPPQIALQPYKTYFRAGDHQLMTGVFPGEAVSQGAYPNLFKVETILEGDKLALPVTHTGCKLDFEKA